MEIGLDGFQLASGSMQCSLRAEQGRFIGLATSPLWTDHSLPSPPLISGYQKAQRLVEARRMIPSRSPCSSKTGSKGEVDHMFVNGV